jgi:hypothetical protein
MTEKTLFWLVKEKHTSLFYSKNSSGTTVETQVVSMRRGQNKMREERKDGTATDKSVTYSLQDTVFVTESVTGSPWVHWSTDLA